MASLQSDRERSFCFSVRVYFTNVVSTACMTPLCSGLKKQKADASVIKTIKPAAAPSAIVRDRSNEWKKEPKRNFEKVAVCRCILNLIEDLHFLESDERSNCAQILQPM